MFPLSMTQSPASMLVLEFRMLQCHSSRDRVSEVRAEVGLMASSKHAVVQRIFYGPYSKSNSRGHMKTIVNSNNIVSSNMHTCTRARVCVCVYVDMKRDRSTYVFTFFKVI